MNLEEVRTYCLSLPGVTEDSPYGPDMIVFRIENKIFLHLPLEYADPRMVVKLLPEKGEELRDRYDAVLPAFHMNKTHWNEILIDGYFSDEMLKEWMDESYRLVVKGLPKRLREKWQ